ncbi:MAG: family 10 glycosylhydrolase [Tannerellaceae bacterium]|nr:family 10 glycosylhydrolase [Tannerellaceae bacterium]
MEKTNKKAFPPEGRGGFLLLFLFFLFPLQAVEPLKHEIRGVWLTTIYGLDWPTRPATTGADQARQKEELCRMLDQLYDANFNTVFLQVRHRGDVIYPSGIEPLSRVFTGTYGQAPGYDPLAFAIQECHKRNMECHAWLVTFPVGTDQVVRQQGNQSVVKRTPGLCKKHDGEWYLDPGMPGTADYLVSLVRELTSRYNIDGIHFDYIRYPDKANRFPDQATYKKYGKGLPLAQWRRDNINHIVGRLYDTVKEIKPWVQVSSAPLGKYNRIERNPNAGWTAYETVHQDPKAWLEAGKHDMLVPMMYYLHDDFFPFVDTWVEQANGRFIVPGLGVYRLDEAEADWELSDITDQIDYSRHAGGAGSAFFRTAHLLEDQKGIYKELQENYYKYPAQLPPMPWMDTTVPPTPSEVLVERNGNELRLSWDPLSDEAGEYTYTVHYSLTDNIDTNSARCILSTGIRGTELFLPVQEEAEMGFTFSVTASSRARIESPPSYETFYYLSKYIK